MTRRFVPVAGPESSGRPPSGPSTARAARGGDLRRELVREDPRLRPGRCCAARAALRQPRRSRCRAGDVHADAEPRGGIECDFTVTRLAENSFRIVTGTAFRPARSRVDHPAPPRRRLGAGHGRDLGSRLFRHLGPKARAILEPLTTADLSNEAFPYMRARELAIGRVPCLALRVTYVGDLGWELYCRSEFGLALWDTVWAAGREHGLVAGGYKAIDSLRLEKGTGSGARTSRPRTHAIRGGARLCREAREGRLRRPRRAPRCPRAGAHAALPHTRRPARHRAGLGARPVEVTP